MPLKLLAVLSASHPRLPTGSATRRLVAQWMLSEALGKGHCHTPSSAGH